MDEVVEPIELPIRTREAPGGVVHTEREIIFDSTYKYFCFKVQ